MSRLMMFFSAAPDVGVHEHLLCLATKLQNWFEVLVGELTYFMEEDNLNEY